MKTKKTNNQVTNLRNANKEVKSLSGVIKLIKTFWSVGYKEAFTPFGVTYKSELKDITALCQKDIEGNIYIVARKAKKDNEDNVILDKEGKKIMEQYNKIVTDWSASTLYKVLEQTIQKNNIE